MSFHSDLHLDLMSMASDPLEDPLYRSMARKKLRDAGWDYHPTVSDWPHPKESHDPAPLR